MSEKVQVKAKTPAAGFLVLPLRMELLERKLALNGEIGSSGLVSQPALLPAQRTTPCPASPRRCPFGGACHTCPVGLQAKLAVSQPGDEFEREADRVASLLMQTSRPQAASGQEDTSGPILSLPAGQVPIMIQCNGGASGMALAEVRRRRVRQSYESFINNAERYGLPVRLLRRVARDYPIRYGSDEVSTIFNEMTLEEETLRSVEGMAPALPIGEASGIRIIYEESVHAYLDLVEDEPRWREFIAAGERHYQGAPVGQGRVTTDPSRLFNEAAANYVAHRVASWWMAFESLSIYVAMSASNPQAARRIREGRMFDKVRADYDRAMRETMFGYSKEGGFLGIGAEQAGTTRPISREMKVFMDRVLLEGRIPDHFDQVAGFQRLLREAGVQLSQPSSPRPEVQRKAGLQPALDADLDDRMSAEECLSWRRAAGRPLDVNSRSFFEQRLGHDLSRVRIHTDARSAESARALNARAYTLGQDIVFGTGQYEPGTSAGRRLLAHELAHVVQQDAPTEAANVIYRWKSTGDRATCDKKDDTLGNLALQQKASFSDWTCIKPIHMQVFDTGRAAESQDSNYDKLVQVGDEFDISNLTAQDGPHVQIHLFEKPMLRPILKNILPSTIDDASTVLQAPYMPAQEIAQILVERIREPGTDPNWPEIARRYYPDIKASSGNVDTDLNLAAKGGARPIKALVLLGHSWAAQSAMSGTGMDFQFVPADLASDWTPSAYKNAKEGHFPRRCWFTRNAEVRSISCGTADWIKGWGKDFSKVYIRKGTNLWVTTAPVIADCYRLFDAGLRKNKFGIRPGCVHPDALAFEAAKGVGSPEEAAEGAKSPKEAEEGPFATAAELERPSRYWTLLRGQL